MAKFDLRKRNEVIQKYCPELFEKEPPPDKGKLLGTGEVPIDVLILLFNEAGDPTDAWALKQHVLQNVFSDDEEFKQSLRTVRAHHLETDTIVFDTAEISREAGREMLEDIFRATSDRPYRFRGMTQQEIAHALLGASAAEPERAAPAVQSLSLEEFFDGNHDDSSIAPNIVGYGHPGIDTFRETLFKIRSHANVLDVRVSVHEWPFPDETDVWIAAENIYIWARHISDSQLEEWLAPLHPTNVVNIPEEFIPMHGPQTDESTRVFTAIWD